jgi:hypothetical protein
MNHYLFHFETVNQRNEDKSTQQIGFMLYLFWLFRISGVWYNSNRQQNLELCVGFWFADIGGTFTLWPLFERL